MKSETLERLTLLNTGLLLVLAWKVFFASPSASAPSLTSVDLIAPTPVEPLSRPSQQMPQDVPPSNGGANNYEELLLQTIEPLEKAFGEHGEDITLPTDEQLQAAIQSNNLQSDASKEILAILEAGYQRFNMPFPTLEIPKPRTSSNKAPQQNDAPENALPPPFGEWLRRTTDALMTELKEKKESPAGLIPTEQQLQSAVSSGDPLSDESQLVIDMLKNGYARMRLDFPEYGKSTTTDTVEKSSKSLRQQVSQQRILKAYFQGQLQRLKLEANSQSKSIEQLLPSEETIDKAVNSGSLKTPEAQAVVTQLKECYEALGLTFYSPPTE